MRSRNAVHQHHCKNGEVFFAIGKGVPRACQGTFEQAEISDEMTLAGIQEFEPVVFNDSLYRNPNRFIRQGAL
jgi:hypothetical protein